MTFGICPQLLAFCRYKFKEFTSQHLSESLTLESVAPVAKPKPKRKANTKPAAAARAPAAGAIARPARKRQQPAKLKKAAIDEEAD